MCVVRCAWRALRVVRYLCSQALFAVRVVFGACIALATLTVGRVGVFLVCLSLFASVALASLTVAGVAFFVVLAGAWA